MDDIEKVREIFKNDRYAADTGAFIEEIGDHYAKCSLVLNAHHKNAAGGIMGGVYFTLADLAFAVAANRQKMGTVSINSDISFLGVPKSGKIFAETTLIKDGRTVCCYNVSVTDSVGTPLAAVKIVGYHK